MLINNHCLRSQKLLEILLVHLHLHGAFLPTQFMIKSSNSRNA
jgi:hypothetical protein